MEELFYGQQRTPLQQDMSLAVTPDPVLNPGPKTVSAAKVFGVAAKHNLGGAAGGLGGGVLGGALAGAALTGPAAPVGAVIGGLVGGLGGGMLGTKLQEAVDPTYDEDAKFLAEQAEAHKTALILGSLAPNAVAFRPSPSVIKQLASVPGQLRGLPGATLGETFGKLTAGQRAAMGNVALGGVFGAVPTAGKMVTGQPVDPEEAAYEIAAGLALHQPWGVGRMMGMHPIQSPDVEPGNILSPAIRESISEAVKEAPAKKPRAKKQGPIEYSEMDTAGGTTLDTPQMESQLSQQSPNADAFPPGDVRSKEGVNLPEGTFTKSERALAKELTGKQIDEPTFKKNTAAYYDKQRLAKFAETPDKPWAGKFNEREAGNDPAVAERGAGWNADTDFHEQSGHGMQNDLARSANPFENQLQRTLETTAATDKDYLAWKAEVEKSNAAGNTPVDPSVNEYLARELGNQHLMKILKEPGKWTPEDFAAAKRVKAGKASLDDLVRYTNNYQQHGPDYLTSLQRSGGKYGPKMYASEQDKEQSKNASWITEEQDRLVSIADKLGIKDKIAELSKTMTAKEVAANIPELKNAGEDASSIVRSVRNRAGIPAQDEQFSQESLLDINSPDNIMTPHEDKKLNHLRFMKEAYPDKITKTELEEYTLLEQKNQRQADKYSQRNLNVKDLEPDAAIQKALEWYHNPQVKESYKVQFAGLPKGTVREKVAKLQAKVIKNALPDLTSEQVAKLPLIVGAEYKGLEAKAARRAEAQGVDLVANEQQKEADSLAMRNWKPTGEEYDQLNEAARRIIWKKNEGLGKLESTDLNTYAENAVARMLNGELGTRRTPQGDVPFGLKVKPGEEGFVDHLIKDHLQTAASREYDDQAGVELGAKTPTASLNQLQEMGLDVNTEGRLGKESAAESVEAENAGAETSLKEDSVEDVAAGIPIEKLETPFKPSKELKSLLYGAQDHLYGKTGSDKEQAAFAKKFLFDENGIQSDFLDALREKGTADGLRYHDELIKELAGIEKDSYQGSVPAPTTFVDFVKKVMSGQQKDATDPVSAMLNRQYRIIASDPRELEHFSDRVYNDFDTQKRFTRNLSPEQLKEFNAFMTDQRAVMRRRILAIEDQQSAYGSMEFPKVLRVKGEKVVTPKGEPSFESIMPEEAPAMVADAPTTDPENVKFIQDKIHKLDDRMTTLRDAGLQNSRRYGQLVQERKSLLALSDVDLLTSRSKGFPSKTVKYSDPYVYESPSEPVKNPAREMQFSRSNAAKLKRSRAQEQFSVQSPLDNPEFKRWFGESKVVDEHGRPKVVYHGSSKGGIERHNGQFSYYTSDPDIAGSYSIFGDGTVQGDYLKIENPLVVKGNGKDWRDVEVFLDGDRKPYKGTSEIAQKAFTLGYDGVIFKDILDTHSFLQNSTKDLTSDVYAVLGGKARIKSATGNSGAFDPSNPDIRYSVQSIVPDVLKSTADKVERQFPEVGGAYKKAKETEGLLRGKLVDGPVQRIIKLMPLYRSEGRGLKAWVNDFLATDSPDNRAVVDYRRALMAGEKPPSLTARQQEINNIVDDVIEQSALETEKRTGNDIERIHGYLGDVIKPEVLDVFTKDPTGPEALRLKDIQLEYWKDQGMSDAEIANASGEFFGGFGKDKPNRAEQFGPVDKSKGYGLAPELRSDNLLDILSRTGRRYATRLAYMDHFENSPDTMAALKKAAPHKQVQLLMDDLNGVREDVEGTRTAIAGVIRAGMMQTMTGVNDFVTTFPLGMRHMAPEQTLKAFAGGLRDIRKNWQESFEMGVNRSNLDNLQMSEDGMTNIETTLNTARNVMNRVTGRNFFEQAARSFAYSTGKVLAWDAAHGGSSLGNMKEKFVKDFFPEGKASTDPEIIKQAAKRYVESVQGTYTYQGLPEISQKGSLAPYLSLSRWNIEQLNNFDRHVFKPALEGNYMPLAMATLGMVIGGKAVEEIRQVVMNRKSKLPTANEILESEQPIKGTMYKAAGLAALAGYAGFYGDLARGAADLAIGNRPQEMNNPLLQGMGDGLGLATKYMTALADGQPVQAMELFHQFVTTYLQGARILNNQVSGEEMTKADKFRDLRVFKQLNHGELPPAGSETPNPFMRPKERRFKQTEDLSEAVGLAPELISEAIDANNPEQTETNLRRIKSNSYQIMPSPEHRPGEFTKFRDYLERTQGADEASSRTTDYLRRNAINKAKSTMIP